MSVENIGIGFLKSVPKHQEVKGSTLRAVTATALASGKQRFSSGKIAFCELGLLGLKSPQAQNAYLVSKTPN